MTRGKGSVARCFDEKLDGRSQLIGAWACHEGLQNEVAKKSVKQKGDAHCHAESSGLGEEEQYQRNGYPKDAAATECGDGRDRLIEKVRSEISLDEVQNGKFYAHACSFLKGRMLRSALEDLVGEVCHDHDDGDDNEDAEHSDAEVFQVFNKSHRVKIHSRSPLIS